MKKFILEITELDNATFTDGAYADANEMARILREVSDRLEGGVRHGICRDVNGNDVGTFGFFGED